MLFSAIPIAPSQTNEGTVWSTSTQKHRICFRKNIPYLTYCYLGLKLSVENLLMQPHFFPNGELWRSRKIDEGTMRDVYDGQIWSDFQFYDNEPFLSEPGNYGLMLNMDFFQPYKHVQYSLGAIYITVLNLPRTLRNKAHNVILVGLIPGPHEPKHDINSFLTPLVSDTGCNSYYFYLRTL